VVLVFFRRGDCWRGVLVRKVIKRDQHADLPSSRDYTRTADRFRLYLYHEHRESRTDQDYAVADTMTLAAPPLTVQLT
jgi:hypothetical protein